jgi:hypothetical protein
MAERDLIELLVAVHFDPPEGKAVLVSDTGRAAQAKWLPKRLLNSFHLTGKTTQGEDRSGRRVTLPMAHLTCPEWLAKREGLI